LVQLHQLRWNLQDRCMGTNVLYRVIRLTCTDPSTPTDVGSCAPILHCVYTQGIRAIRNPLSLTDYRYTFDYYNLFLEIFCCHICVQEHSFLHLSLSNSPASSPLRVTVWFVVVTFTITFSYSNVVSDTTPICSAPILATSDYLRPPVRKLHPPGVEETTPSLLSV
jgi:hypothetical protein